jgi:hypothetical protein
MGTEGFIIVFGIFWASWIQFRYSHAVAVTITGNKSTAKKWSCPATRHGGAWGERRCSSYSFLTSALDGGEWSASRPGRASHPRKGPPVPTHCTGGWVGPRAGPDAGARGKVVCLCRWSNPGRPARSQTLYWLSYPGSVDCTYCCIIDTHERWLYLHIKFHGLVFLYLWLNLLSLVMIYTDCIVTIVPPSGQNDPIPWFGATARDSLGQRQWNDACVLCSWGWVLLLSLCLDTAMWPIMWTISNPLLRQYMETRWPCIQRGEHTPAPTLGLQCSSTV